jgi:hypothetical protein
MHQYHVEFNDGQSFMVTTEKYHEDHPESVFFNHLLDLINRTVPLVMSQVIVRAIYKGRK